MTSLVVQRGCPRGWLFLILGGLVVVAAPSHAQNASGRQWITESTVTFGRQGGSAPNDSYLAYTLLLADVGLRWSVGSSRSVGFSLAGGYDVPNEAVLGGARARVAIDWRSTRLEGSAGLFASSLAEGGVGGILGVAFYPFPWVALVAQADILPTLPADQGLGLPHDPEDPMWPYPIEPEYGPHGSVGIRLGDKAGIASWVIAPIVGLIAATGESIN